MRGFRDRDYLRTKEGYSFCVVGPIHPEDRVIAYLKYIPDPSGKWGRGEARFRRALRYYTMPSLLETLKFLEGRPEYLYDSPVMGVTMSAVPLDMISAHLKPEEKISQLTRMEEPDTLQRKLVDLTILISDVSGVPLRNLGVTGSVLLDIHQDFSDIDLIVYGVRTSEAVKDALIKMHKRGGSPVRPFDEEMSREWCMNKAENYPLTYDEATKIFKRKWGRAIFRGTMFSVHPVKLEEEVAERYGDRVFKPEGMVRIEAKVTDSSESEFLPSVYGVEEVRILDGPLVRDIHEVTSYEGLYGGVAEKGEKLLVYGKLERVIIRKDRAEYHRVLVGSKEAKGQDYVKPV